MGTEIPPRNLIRVERGVEEALRNFTGVQTNGSDFTGAQTNGSELPEITVAEPTVNSANMSGIAIGEASEMTARDIEEAGQAAVDIAADIMKEAQQLAAELRASGQKMSEHLREFAVLAKRVSTAMRDTQADVLNSSEKLLKN